MTIFVRISAPFLFALALAFPVFAQQPPSAEARKQLEYTRSHYTKYEYRIPMRDGVKLFTAVYVPKESAQPYPIIMQRTPYSVAPYGIDNYRPVVGPSEALKKEGFIFAYQDVRGRFLVGRNIHRRPSTQDSISGPKETDESTDTYDTIDWLEHPNNNGRVGIWGISYPGFFAAYSLINSHPALKAVSPQAPMGDVGNGDDAYHNGAFHLAANFGFYSGFKPRGPDPSAARPAETGRSITALKTSTISICGWVRWPTRTSGTSRMKASTGTIF